MARHPNTDIPLTTRILAAHSELKLARQDGSAQWISAAARDLDALLDLIPRSAD